MNHTYSLIKGSIDEDNTAFSWQRKPTLMPTPPILGEVFGRLYRLSNFPSAGKEYLVTKLNSFDDALALSLETARGEITLCGIASIYKICLSFNLSPEKFSVFKDFGIKGNKSFEILKLIPSLPEKLLDYLDSRNVPIKTAGLLTGFNDNALAFICDFVTKTNPSWQNFKKMAETVADFKNAVISQEYSENWEAPNVKSAERKEIESALRELQKNVAPCKIFSADDFESGRLTFSAELSSINDYEKIIKILTASQKDVSKFFDLLKKYDLC